MVWLTSTIIWNRRPWLGIRVMSGILLLLALVITTGCVTNRRYPGGIRSDEGEISIVLDRPVLGLSVMVDEHRVMSSRRLETREVRVRNVPPGGHTIEVRTNSWTRRRLACISH